MDKKQLKDTLLYTNASLLNEILAEARKQTFLLDEALKQSKKQTKELKWLAVIVFLGLLALCGLL